jgi:hypothetical protein
MKRTLSIAAVVVALLVGRPGPSRAVQPGQEFSMAIAAAAANLLYTPAKVVTAVVGFPVGAMCGWLTGGDVRSAYAVWVPTMSGSYFLTPANIEGREPILFFGTDYGDKPSKARGPYTGGIYDVQYAR